MQVFIVNSKLKRIGTQAFIQNNKGQAVIQRVIQHKDKGQGHGEAVRYILPDIYILYTNTNCNIYIFI